MVFYFSIRKVKILTRYFALSKIRKVYIMSVRKEKKLNEAFEKSGSIIVCIFAKFMKFIYIIS